MGIATTTTSNNSSSSSLKKSSGCLEARKAWNSMLKFQLLGSSHVAQACILNVQTGQLWSSAGDEEDAENFRPYPYYYEVDGKKINEALSIVQLCQEQPSSNNTFSFRLNKQKYHVLRRDILSESERKGSSSKPVATIYGKSASSKIPICIVATSQCIVVALGAEEVPGPLNALLNSFAEYLIQNQL